VRDRIQVTSTTRKRSHELRKLCLALAPVDALDAPRFHGWFSLVFEVPVAKHVFGLSVQFVRVQVKIS
jgi:hypothetical protein